MKSDGTFWLVVKSNLRSFIERVLKNISPKYEIVAQGKEHVVIKADK